jgi:hypothetical protein
MSPVEEVKVEALKRQFPHVDDIEDWRAKTSVRLLWDRVFDLEGRLQATEATVARLVAASNTQETQLDDLALQVADAVAQAALAQSTASAVGEGPQGGGKDDLGLGAQGCSAAGPDGHLTGEFEKTVENAGKIVCGVGNEFADLRAATATRAAREANRDELLERMVWHLNQAGFAAARYGTPGTPEHAFNLLFDCLSLQGEEPMREYAYRVTTYDPENDPWDTTHTYETCMVCNGQTPGTTTTPGAGIAD